MNVQLLLQRIDKRRNIYCLIKMPEAHTGDVFRSVGLRLIQGGQIAGFAAGDLLVHKLAVFHQDINAVVGGLCVNADKLRRDGRKLFPGNETVPVSGIMYQLKENGGADAVFAVTVNAHLQRHGVRLGEAAADVLGGENIRVISQKLKSLIPVKLIHAHGQDGPQTERAHKLHQPPDTCLLPEAPGYLLRLCGAYAPNFGEKLGGILQNIKGLFPEFVHDQRCRGGPYPPDGATRQIVIYGVGGGGQQSLGKFRLKLPAVDGVGHPLTADDHGLAG